MRASIAKMSSCRLRIGLVKSVCIEGSGIGGGMGVLSAVLCCALVASWSSAQPLFDETTTTPVFETALQQLKTDNLTTPEALARLGVASRYAAVSHISVLFLFWLMARPGRSEAAYYWPEITLAFLRRSGRGLVESCDDAAARLKRVATALVADLQRRELKAELRKRYLFLVDETHSTEEDVVQFHEYAAAAGEAASQVTLGDFYLHGSYGLNASHEKAYLYFQAAARQGDARGRSLLGFMTEKGYGAPADAGAALELYKQAAEQNDSFGMVRLGLAHLQGRLGLTPDPKQAEQLLTTASKSGSAQAWLGLGLLHTKSDDKKAVKFFLLAAQKGSTLAAYELAQIQLKDATLCASAVQNLAHVVEWSDPVLRVLARAYRDARRGHVEEALSLYERLAWGGVEEAQANAAYLLHKQLNDVERARRYYELSAEQGNANSHLMLGNYYYERNSLNLSHTAYRRAAELHHFEAQYNLGYMYQFGLGVPTPDVHLAKRHYDMALATNPAALYAVYLSLAYLHLTTSSLSSLVTGALSAVFNLFAFWWNDSIVIAILTIVLVSLLSARMMREN